MRVEQNIKEHLLSKEKKEKKKERKANSFKWIIFERGKGMSKFYLNGTW